MKTKERKEQKEKQRSGIDKNMISKRKNTREKEFVTRQKK